MRAAGCRRKRRGSAAHLWCVLALGEKVMMKSIIHLINLLRWMRICRRPPRSADQMRRAMGFFVLLPRF